MKKGRKSYFVPQLREKGPEAIAILQGRVVQRAPYAFLGRQYIDDRFNEWCIWRGPDAVCPDWTTLDYPLQIIVKETIFQLRLTTFEDLKTIIRECFNDSQQSRRKMSRRTWEKIKIWTDKGYTAFVVTACTTPPGRSVISSANLTLDNPVFLWSTIRNVYSWIEIQTLLPQVRTRPMYFWLCCSLCSIPARSSTLQVIGRKH